MLHVNSALSQWFLRPENRFLNGHLAHILRVVMIFEPIQGPDACGIGGNERVLQD
jgi:hypothetical protein